MGLIDTVRDKIVDQVNIAWDGVTDLWQRLFPPKVVGIGTDFEILAADSRDKRASCIGNFLITPSLFPDPDGTIGAGDRQFTAYAYVGILAAAPIPKVPVIGDGLITTGARSALGIGAFAG